MSWRSGEGAGHWLGRRGGLGSQPPFARRLRPYAFLFVAFNLRCSVTSLSPLVPTIERQLNLSAFALGALSALPLACMALFAPSAAKLLRVLKPTYTVGAGLSLIAVATSARVFAGSVTVLFLTSFVAGIGIAILNSVLPEIIHVTFPGKSEIPIAVYVFAIDIGASAPPALSIPLSHTRIGWTGSLAIWGLTAGVALVLWMVSSSSKPDVSPEAPDPAHIDEPRHPIPGSPKTKSAPGSLWRDPRVIWACTYMTLQACIFYALLSWLPAEYASHGVGPSESGLLLAVFNCVEIGSIILPVIARRRIDRRPYLFVSATATLVGLLGLATVPTFAPWLTVSLLGFGVGAMFPLGMIVIVDYGSVTNRVAELAGMAFLVSYGFAALSPLAIGGLRDATGGFGAGNIALIVTTLALGLAIQRLVPPGALQGRSQLLPGPS